MKHCFPLFLSLCELVSSHVVGKMYIPAAVVEHSWHVQRELQHAELHTGETERDHNDLQLNPSLRTPLI